MYQIFSYKPTSPNKPQYNVSYLYLINLQVTTQEIEQSSNIHWTGRFTHKEGNVKLLAKLSAIDIRKSQGTVLMARAIIDLLLTNGNCRRPPIIE